MNINVLKNRTIFELEDKLLPVIQHGFLRSEENVILISFEHLKMYGKMCILYFLWTLMFGC